MVRVHHAQWYVPRNRGELPWLTDDLKLVRKQIWNFKDGKAASWAQGELTALLQMVDWDQGDRILVPIPASTMQRTFAEHRDTSREGAVGVAVETAWRGDGHIHL